jgi:sugar lactone lactonase YvrE
VTAIPTVVARTFVEGLYFGECPRWHDERLWYSDFFANAVSSVGESGDARVEVVLSDEPAGLGWLPDGRLLVVARTSRLVLRVEPGGLQVVHGDLSELAAFHCNDMVVDASGRAYVGTFGFDLDRFVDEKGGAALYGPPGAPPASLLSVDPDGKAGVAARDVIFPNGAVITDDGSTLLLAETLARRITAFDRTVDGALSGRRVWADFESESPDGICLDAEGRVWVANAATSECLLVAEGGQIVGRVATSQNCYACMLGGEDRCTLYLMTAPTGTEKVARQALRGRIEQARVEVGGAGQP